MAEEQARLQAENEALRAQLAAANANPPAVAHVSVKIGAFWKRHPQLWFTQLEAQFQLANVTSDSTKYYHLISKLDAEILECCSDLIRVPLANDKYKTVKARIIKDFSASSENKIQQLLRGCELGDRCPSQLLREMKNLAGGIITGEGFLKKLWLQRLPETTQAVLKVSEDTLDLATLAEQADKLADIVKVQPAIMAINDPLGLDEMKAQIAALGSEISAFRRQAQGLSRNQRLPRNASQGTGDESYCYFHLRFGAAARKCREPCSFRPKI